MEENREKAIEDLCFQQVYDYLDNYEQKLGRPVSQESLETRLEMEVSEVLNNVAGNVYPPGKEELKRRVRVRLEIAKSQTDQPTYSLVDKAADHIPWLENEKDKIEWSHWQIYRNYLRKKQAPLSQLKEISNSTEQILSYLENPNRPAPWDVRGLVVGNIQAGKTSNYIGLLAKAVDAGYRILIVLAGTTNDLRSQTQKRIDEGLLGYDSSKSEPGKFASSRQHKGRIIQTKTTSDLNGDYGKAISFVNTRFDGEDAILYVVKKNASILRNIYSDLQNNLEINGKIAAPMIMIDDEADNASVNGKQQSYDLITGKLVDKNEIDPAQVNKYIRAILSSFEKVAYVAYTATPYANIFIMPNEPEKRSAQVYDDKLKRDIIIGEDLFPRNFIVELSSGANYYGPDSIFGIEGKPGLPIVLKTSQFEDEASILRTSKTGKSVKFIATEMPESMRYAIDCFIISAAGKNVRRCSIIHNTMLIHVDRLNATQKKVLEWVSEYISGFQSIFRVGTVNRQQSYLNTLFSIWTEEYSPKFETIKSMTKDTSLTQLDWESVEKEIRHVILSIECLEINSKNGKKGFEYDKYKNGRTLIAIGGDKLARGLTLEGLSISYFMRHSRMYDSLLQMGRWFGYRTGYIDLSRIFASEQLIRNYQIITKANEDLSEQFHQLATMQPARSPRDFGLMVKTDPSSILMVTALNKSKNTTKRKISFSGNATSIPYITKDATKNNENYEKVRAFIRELEELGLACSNEHNAYIWKNVPVAEILSGFIGREFYVDPQNTLYSYDALAKYIEKLNKEFNELTNWTVALVQGDGKKMGNVVSITDTISVSASSRTIFDPSEDNFSYYEINQRRLATGTNESIDLTKVEFKKALDATNAARSRENKKPTTTPSPVEIRKARPATNALLVLYFLGLHTDDNSAYIPGVFPSFMISFSESGHGREETEVEYQLNAIAEREYRKRFENDKS